MLCYILSFVFVSFTSKIFIAKPMYVYEVLCIIAFERVLFIKLGVHYAIKGDGIQCHTKAMGLIA